MRSFVGICLLLGLTLAQSPADAQELQELRKELEEMRKQFETMKGQYEKAIDTMTERIKRLESQPQPTVAPPATAQPLAVSQAPPGGGQPTPLELVRPREPFSLYERRGAGQLLFDMGLTGDFIGNLTSNKVQQTMAGTFTGLENYFFPREIELGLFGQIDPYASAYVFIEAGQESRGEEVSVTLAEAALTLLTLPYGTQLKMGQMRNRFGLLNQLHDHALPQIDRPDVLVRFFGEEGLTEKGAELTWIPPLPFFLETLVGLFNGDNETAFGDGSLREPLVTGRLRTFFELGDSGAIQVGVSGAHGTTQQGLSSNLAGFDVKYKYRPEGWQHPLLTLGGEWLYSNRKVAQTSQVEVQQEDGSVTTEEITQKQTLNRFGWYAYAELQPWRRWALGARYDWTRDPVNPGLEQAIEPYVAFWPSEFLFFRLGYKYTTRSSSAFLYGPDSPSARIANEIFFQSSFVLGAHPAHPF